MQMKSCALWCSVLIGCFPSAAVDLLSVPPGPKSGTTTMTSWRPDETTMSLGPYYTDASSRRGEGSGNPMVLRKGVYSNFGCSHPRKIHGSGQVESYGMQRPCSKRSYCRAIRRASTLGWTFYRGQLMISSTAEPPASNLSKPCRANPFSQKKTQPRARIVSWNVGGLTTQLYHEITHWLSIQELDVCMLQGTRWREDRTWSTHGYHFIQCGNPDEGDSGHSGLLTIVSNKFCSMDSLSYATVIPGRLQHVKCKFDNISCDFLNVYQHPMNTITNRTNPLASRHELWQKLDEMIQRLPFRNVALIGGDFNCTTNADRANSSELYPDALEFTELLRKHNLSTVRSHDNTPSYQGPTGHANIDYVFMRRSQMDGEAHQGKCLPMFPLASWRSIPDHLPTAVSFPVGWKCWYQPKRAPKFSCKLRDQVIQARDQNHPNWDHYMDQATGRLQRLPQDPKAIETLADWSTRFCTKHFESKPSGPSHLLPTRPTVKHMWHLREKLGRICSPEISSLFQAWLLSTQIRKEKKVLDQQCREAKIHRVENAVHQAETAARQHDTRKLFATIRTLCPKQRQIAIRFRGANGQALGMPHP